MTFRVLYVFVVLLHHRRKVVHFNVSDSPTAAWTAQQITEAFPHDSAPRFLLRDRDSIYGGEFRRRAKSIGIAEVLTTPRSPWQNPFAERVIGTIRRELLDHVIVLNEGPLRRRLRNYFRYYHGSRTHLALDKDAPEPRAVESPAHGQVVALPRRRTSTTATSAARRRHRSSASTSPSEGDWTGARAKDLYTGLPFTLRSSRRPALFCDSLSATVLEGAVVWSTPFRSSFGQGHGAATRTSRYPSEPIENHRRIRVRREDRVEDMRDPTVVDHEGYTLQQRHPIHLERGQA